MPAATSPPLRQRLLRVDTVSGLLLVAISAALWLQILPLDLGTLSYFGPGFLPRILVTALSVLAIVLTVLGLTATGSAESVALKLRGPIVIGLSVLVFAATIRGLTVAGVRIPQLGLFVAAPVTVVIAGYGTREADWRELVALGLGLTALTAFVFGDMLAMTIPLFPAAVADALPSAWREWPARGVCLIYGLIALGMALALRRQPTVRAR